MSSFKVKEGTHIDGSGKVYQKGEVVESDSDLVALFPGKFTLETESKSKSKAVDEDAGDEDEEKDEGWSSSRSKHQKKSKY